ncbi:MAG: HK97 family phage prohead protease [Alphaproteobacteria bacterium]|nr:HK97 family phage prohead protease [Alphaproteobacteria bacterium]
MNDVFAGYACIFNEVDLGNDVILPAAFEASLREKMPQNISMLWQHDPNQPIGRWEEMRIDKKGLYVVGRLTTHNIMARLEQIFDELPANDDLTLGYELSSVNLLSTRIEQVDFEVVKGVIEVKLLITGGS